MNKINKIQELKIERQIIIFSLQRYLSLSKRFQSYQKYNMKKLIKRLILVDRQMEKYM